MLRFILSTLFLILALPGLAQDFIGMPAGEIRRQMRTRQKDFVLDETTVNKVYRYLKYVDKLETTTILFFLSDHDTCTYYKVIYDSYLLPSVKRTLDSTCRRISDTLWIEETGGHRYNKVLKEQEWFFTVITRPAEKPSARVIPEGKRP